MNKDDFLSELQHSKEINIIGPLLQPKELSLLAKNSPYLIVDGGSKFLNKLGKSIKSLLIGDGDSSHEEMDVLLPTNKDISDLAYGLSLIPNNITQVNLLGFLGGRKDHELCNIGEINQFLKNRSIKTQVTWDQQMQTHTSGIIKFVHHGLFSLANLETSIISIDGKVKYHLRQQTVVPFSSRCLSNYGSGPFKVSSSTPFTIYFASEDKLE